MELKPLPFEMVRAPDTSSLEVSGGDAGADNDMQALTGNSRSGTNNSRRRLPALLQTAHRPDTT